MLKVKANDIINVLGMHEGSELPSRFYFGSVVSYALESGYCPIEAYERTIANMQKYPYNDHKTHWCSPDVSMLTSCRRELPEVVGTLDLGDVVHFEGRYFRLEEARNKNIKLVEVSREEAYELDKQEAA